MNRAERRGNHRFLKRADSGVTGMALNRAVPAAEVTAGQHHATAMERVSEGSDTDRARNAKGRFVRAVPVVPASVVQVETRQQRRYAARQALKSATVVPAPKDLKQVAADVWDEVTQGSGVVLVDGKPLPSNSGKEVSSL